MQNNVKPTFGAINPITTTENKSSRPSIGAIWKRTSKDTKKDYMNMNIKLSKQKLQELINTAAEDEVQLKFVAFPNTYEKDKPTTPDFRIYEETTRTENK